MQHSIPKTPDVVKRIGLARGTVGTPVNPTVRKGSVKTCAEGTLGQIVYGGESYKGHSLPKSRVPSELR